VLFAGHHLSGATLAATLASLASLDYAVNVISKSGTTTEPGIAFRVFRSDLERRHGEGWRPRVVATTDVAHGALRMLADEEDLVTFEVPDDVGGRFSVLSPVGLLPLGVAGVDLAALLAGAGAMAERCLSPDPAANPAMRLAATRIALYEAGHTVDVLSFTAPALRRLAGWWQQLFGESEGKEGKGPFPAVCEIPADLHSLGQYLQDGHRQVQETFLHVEEDPSPVTVSEGDDRDGLGYLAGHPLSEVLAAARGGTMEAHLEGGVPVSTITVDRLDAGRLGALFMLFEVTVSLGGAMLEVNPFDQPGVEAYKRNMFRLLGRPGS
jgi:glucose-6-phosphate isomerase